MESIPQLRPRNDVHFARKVFHFLGVVLLAVCYHNMVRETALLVLTCTALAAVVVEVVRRFVPALNSLVLQIFGPVMREYERTSWTGLTYLVLGVLFVVAIFPKHIVTLSLLFLAIADPTASYFGVRYGKDKLFKGKSLQGTVAAFIACSITSIIFYFAHNIMTDRVLIVGILSGLAGAIAEGIPISGLDDNLILPVLSSIQLWVIFYVFGGF